MTKYAYVGPVMVFDKCVASRWKGETIAESESKARSNLTYQYKKKNNLNPGARVDLIGSLNRVG